MTEGADYPASAPPMLVFSLVWLSMVAALTSNVQPVFLGVLAETFHLNGSQLGLLGGAELGGSCLASLTAAYWFPKAPLRKVALLAISMGFLGNMLTHMAADYTQLVLIRFLTGLLGSGILYALTLGLVGQLANPDRVIGIAIFVQVISLAAGLTAIPVLMQHWQLQGVTLMLALLFASGILLFYRLPKRIGPDARGLPADKPLSAVHSHWFLPAGLLLSLIVFSIGLGSVWAFLERLASGNGFDMLQVGSALAVAGLIGGCGALVAAILGSRFGRLMPVAIGIVLEIVACLILATRTDWYSFLLAVAMFNFCWNLTLPFLIAAIAEADTAGRFLVLIPAAQTGGYALGPTLVGLIMVGEHYATGAWISSVMFAICLVLAVTLLTKTRRSVAVLGPA